MRICTIVAREHLPQARVMARTYAQHNHGGPCSVLLIDDPDGPVDGARETFEVVRPDRIVARIEAMAAIYDLDALVRALTPLFLRHLLSDGNEPLAYVDSSVCFYADVDEVGRLAITEGVVSTAHQPGLIALAPGEAAERLLDGWSERGELPIGMPGLHIIRDPGVNVAHWNLHERVVERSGDGYTVNGQPLRSFHFSGFDPARPYALSREQTRIRLPDEPVLAELCEQYAAALREAGFDRERQPRWAYDQLADGTPLSAELRRLYARGEREGAFRLSPFTQAGTSEFVSWCQAPADRGAAYGLTRIALTLYDARPDLQASFPDLDGEDGARFLSWMSHHRDDAADLGLPPAWLPSPGPGGEELPEATAGAPFGVNVAGYLRSELGIGEAARAVITALDARDVPLMPVHGTYAPRSRQGHSFAFLEPDAAQFPVNLICVNPEQLPDFLADAGPAFSEGRYTIGFWWWEVTTFPEPWLGAFELVDEVWVGSEHAAAALRPVSPVPIVKVRIPVTMAPIVPYTRAQLGLPEGHLFLFMFDLHSAIERKNPLGVIEAFREAFPPGSGASLVIKCINRESEPDEYDRLRLAVRGHPDIHLIDRYVSVQEKDAMLAACDCYVSLHRAEGFGLTLAEAMYLGKPVIATAYSGNLDYMTRENSYLVDYAIRGIGAGIAPYPAHGEWADPDTGHAARLMREVIEDPSEAARRGQQAAADIRAGYSADAAGETLEQRLAQVRGHLEAHRPVRHPGPAAPPAFGAETLRELIARGPAPRNGWSPRRLAQRVALRLMRPVIAHQREVSERLVSEVAATRRRETARTAAVLRELRRQGEVLQTLATLEQRLALLEDGTESSGAKRPPQLSTEPAKRDEP